MDNVLERPDWSDKDVKYQILTLARALTENPSITISLSYKRIGAAFKNALTFKKEKSSSLDYFFMEQPQEFIKRKFEVINDSNEKIKRPAFVFKKN